jgi:hypothetical protein
MSLTCSCGDGDYDWWYYEPKLVVLNTKRSRACCSCKERIHVGDECAEFERFTTCGYGSIDERIYGDERPLAPKYLCDRCYGLYESLDDLGFCDLLGQDMRKLAREYAQMQREAGVFKGEMRVAA